MAKFKASLNATQSKNLNEADESKVTVYTFQQNKEIAPRSSFLLWLEQYDHELLKGIASAEDRSMQWILRKLTSEVIRKKANELGIGN